DLPPVHALPTRRSSDLRDALARTAGAPPGTPVGPAAALYFPVRDPIIQQDGPVEGLALEGLLRRELRMRGLYIDRPEVLVLMDRSEEHTSELQSRENLV